MYPRLIASQCPSVHRPRSESGPQALQSGCPRPPTAPLKRMGFKSREHIFHNHLLSWHFFLAVSSHKPSTEHPWRTSTSPWSHNTPTHWSPQQDNVCCRAKKKKKILKKGLRCSTKSVSPDLASKFPRSEPNWARWDVPGKGFRHEGVYSVWSHVKVGFMGQWTFA